MATQRKSAAKKTAGAKSAAKKAPAKKTAAKRAAGSATAEKETLVKQKRSTGDGPACWPGFERVPGKEAGTKGSCKPKPNASKADKQQDAREAAASKGRKSPGKKKAA